MSDDIYDPIPTDASEPAAKRKPGRPPRATVLQSAPEPVPEVLPPQKVKSSRNTRAVIAHEGEQVLMKVTMKGDGQISAGSDSGFDRYEMDALFYAADINARSLYEKGFAEPVHNRREWEQKWARDAALEKRRDAAELAYRDDVLDGRFRGLDASVNGGDVYAPR